MRERERKGGEREGERETRIDRFMNKAQLTIVAIALFNL